MSVTSTQYFLFKLVANGEQLDLFKDEDILLSNNVTGLFDIGLAPSDFTRQISLPGTKKNNAFFEHYYDISIINPFLFATNIKVDAYFDFGGIYLSQGYLQLNKVNVLENKFIDSYEVTIYGTLSSFGRDIQKMFLTDLTVLEKYNHTSSYDNIVQSWDTGSGLFNHDIVYPWCDYGTGWQFTSDVFFGVDDNYGNLSVMDYKPAIRVKAVWDAIFEQTGYTYTSSFWNESWLDDVYMVCNNALKYPEYSDVDLETYGTMKLGALSGSTNVTIPMNTWTTLPWTNELEDAAGSLNRGAYTVGKKSNLSAIFNLNFSVSSSGNLPGQFALRMIETSSAYTSGEIGTIPAWSQYFTQLANGRSSTQSIGQDFELISQIEFPQVQTGSYYFQLKVYEYYVASDPLVRVDPNTSGGDATTKSYIQITKPNQAADGRILDIPSNMPFGTNGIKLVDFITGIQKKFNLVIYQDKTKPNQFIVETFNNWYKQGQVKDFNKYINLNSPIEVLPANNFAVANLNFGDKLDTDYVSQQFRKGANRDYGKAYYVDTQNYFSQGTLNVETTFASDPLIRLPGTGLSGSNTIINPPITKYSAGSWYFTNQNGARYACTSSNRFEIFTADGTITSGQTAYHDQYGTNLVTGYYFFSNGTLIYHINPTTGQIGTFAAMCSR